MHRARQWRNNLISCATLYLAHPCTETAHLCNQFFVQGLHGILEALKLAAHFIQEHIAFCLLLNTAAFSCKHVHRLYISVFEKCAYVVWANDDFLVISLSPSAPSSFLFELQGILLLLLQAACKLNISHFISCRIQACNRGHWCSPSFWSHL